MKIGEFARISGASIKTLRFYDQQGVFRPAHRDALSGYRGYSARQLPELTTILALRALGVSLADLKAFARRPPRDVKCSNAPAFSSSARWIVIAAR
jgi:DNA-binding transcriptional MerR regulator